MSDIALSICQISKRFGQTLALNKLDLLVVEGELLALVGPSGSGKSSLLHCIAGVAEPDEGEITLHGRSLRKVAPGQRDVAMVWQDGALYPHLTVAQNLGFPLKARGKWGQKAVQAMAARLELSPLLNRYPAALSGGERQRVALGRALIRKPKLFLLDEPLSSLDLPLRDRLRSLIRDLVAEKRVTTIYVTHDQAEAMAVGDRVAVLRQGQIRQIGPAQEIYQQPADEYVARFFGQPPMNLLPGKVKDGWVEGPWGKLPVIDGPEDHLVHCGFRPESVAIAGAEGGLCGTLLRLEYQGHETIALISLPEALVRVRLPAGTGFPATGAVVGLRIPPEKIFLFDAASGVRL